MRVILLGIIFTITSTFHTVAVEWVRFVHPDSVNIRISHTRKVVEIETWKLKGNKNFINLSFWGIKGPVGTLVIDSENHGFGKRSWPVLSLSPTLGEYTGGEIKYGFAGSNVLVRNGLAIKQRSSFFTKRRCPRTGVGVMPDGRLIIMVTTSATIKAFAKRFEEHGAKFAINVDGGSSTMFIENGESLWNSKRSAVPVILSW
jgi:hypothetical protein